jgi:hypothetical protein
MLNLRGSSCPEMGILVLKGFATRTHDVVSGRDGYFSFERFCHSCLMLLV